MLAEVLSAIRPRPGGRYFDGTCGGGGHSAALLEASGPDGWLEACDRDEEALAAAHRRLSGFAGRYALHQCNFSEMDSRVAAESFHGAVLDLGTNSEQLTSNRRGFSFQHESAPLDMRLDRRSGPTAAELLNRWSREDLERLLWENDEPQARRIVRKILEARESQPFESVGQLVAAVQRAIPLRPGRIHPATRVFQALRIAVNDELGSLERGLKVALGLLSSGGILAVISFHSGEDRLVKEFMRIEARDYDLPRGEPDLPHLRLPRAPRARLVTRKGLEPTEIEIQLNPRARSARLRVLEKC